MSAGKEQQDTAGLTWLEVAGVAGLALVAGMGIARPLYKRLDYAAGVKLAHSGSNRATSGVREQRSLPVGKHPLQLYSAGTPNGQKVTVALEEMGLAYDAHFISIGGDQFTSGFVEINPNSKIPALVDREGPNGKEIRVFETASILLYLAEKSGKLVPKDPAQKVEMMNWIMWLQGSAPYFGQFGHFTKYAKVKLGYPIERYSMEAQRLLDVLDKQLEGKDYILGSEYTLADINTMPWINCLSQFYNADETLELDSYKNVQKWMARIKSRPAVKLGMQINGFGDSKYRNYSSSGST
ncbi:Glutathione S-transferase [Hondaea fermentalgiana]|uniref:Glutathione S-transferase n=1 Tax=Hondaea fermentalgiana TaxID=2315210 RepID=A0A2R5GYV1_9STRA|nr:Glutathione S-transferase [Hondaea fermentalgiana]|eukprot:GBG33184.1 Glutathione S-transferase [Hondaea fermentalgiana]